jgi:phage terminase large subunit-like protein
MAESKNDGADFTGLTIVDWDSQNNWFIQKTKRYKINITALIELIFEVWRDFKPQVIGVEKKAFNDQIKPLINQKAQELQIFPNVIELEHGGRSKEDRIRGALVGRFELGKVFFKEGNNDDSQILKGELYDFPAGKHDDLIDSLAYVSQIGTRPFGGEQEEKRTIEQEFYAHKRTLQPSVKSRLINL